MNRICIIPARFNSKRIKRKNIKRFNGEPIISLTINKVIESKCFDKVFVSTDSEVIKKIAEKNGAIVPFLRSLKLSKDTITTYEVVRDFVQKLLKLDFKFENIFIIYPTSICTKISHIKKAIKIFKVKRNINYVFLAKQYEHPIERSFEIKKREIKFINPKKLKMQTQLFKKKYYDAGQFYYTNTKTILEGFQPLNSKSFPLIDNNSIIHDIDYEYQWKILEKLFK